MKKLVTLLLMFTLLFCVVGCDNSKPAATPSPSPTPKSEETLAQEQLNETMNRIFATLQYYGKPTYSNDINSTNKVNGYGYKGVACKLDSNGNINYIYFNKFSDGDKYSSSMYKIYDSWIFIYANGTVNFSMEAYSDWDKYWDYYPYYDSLVTLSAEMKSIEFWKYKNDSSYFPTISNYNAKYDLASMNQPYIQKVLNLTLDYADNELKEIGYSLSDLGFTYKA